MLAKGGGRPIPANFWVTKLVEAAEEADNDIAISC
jgi:hypothetical protein